MKKFLFYLLCVALLGAICLTSVACNIPFLTTPEVTTPEVTTPEETTPEQTNQEQPVQDQNALDYSQALALLADGDYAGAKSLFEKLDDYADSEEYLSKFYYMPTRFELELVGKICSIDVTYNSNNLPERDIITRNEDVYDCTFVYDENGNILKQIMNRDGGTYTYEFTYGAQGLPVVAVGVFLDGTQDEHEFTYNEQGKMIRDVYKSGGVVIYDCNPIYGENGNVIREEYREIDPPQIIYISYEYDENGQIIQITRDYGDGQTVVSYTYDDEGYMVKEVYTYDGYYQVIYEYTYDEFGNTIKTVRTEGDIVEFVETEYKLLYLPLDFTVGSQFFFRQYWVLL